MEEIKKKKRFDVFIFVLLIVSATIYGLYSKYRFDSVGVFTIAKVNKFEGDDQGASLFLTIFYNGNEYNTIANSTCNKCLGKFYYVKILPADPGGSPVFYQNNPVPDCILKKEIPKGGWKKMPDCK